MRAAATLQRFSDIDAQAAQLTGFDQRYQQLDGGEYSGAFLAVDGEEVGVFVEHTSRTLHQEGAGPQGAIGVVFLLSDDGASRVNGSRFTGDDLFIIGAGGAYEAVVGAGAVPAVLSVSLDAEPSVPLRRLAAQHDGQVTRLEDAELAAKLRRLSAGTLRSWDSNSNEVEVPVGAVQASMLEVLSGHPAQTAFNRSYEVYRSARVVISQAVNKPLPIPELASQVGASKRTLENAFDTCVGVSPARFIKLVRLNHARRLLETRRHSATYAAAASGLTHLGRFSAEYRDLFGELPSETASRGA